MGVQYQGELFFVPLGCIFHVRTLHVSYRVTATPHTQDKPRKHKPKTERTKEEKDKEEKSAPSSVYLTLEQFLSILPPGLTEQNQLHLLERLEEPDPLSEAEKATIRGQPQSGYPHLLALARGSKVVVVLPAPTHKSSTYMDPGRLIGAQKLADLLFDGVHAIVVDGLKRTNNIMRSTPRPHRSQQQLEVDFGLQVESLQLDVQSINIALGTTVAQLTNADVTYFVLDDILTTGVSLAAATNVVKRALPQDARVIPAVFAVSDVFLKISAGEFIPAARGLSHSAVSLVSLVSD